MKFRGLVWLFILTLSLPVALAQSEGSGSSEGSGPDLLSNPAPEVVLEGVDPISLVQGKESKGRSDLARIYRGFEYHFSSQENLKTFDADPDRYAVANDGLCPVAQVRLGRDIPGDPSVFSEYQGQIYLFGNADARMVFLKEPGTFSKSHPVSGADEMEGSGSEEKEGSGK